MYDKEEEISIWTEVTLVSEKNVDFSEKIKLIFVKKILKKKIRKKNSKNARKKKF